MIADSLHLKITKSLSPVYLEVINESGDHHGYVIGQESHFKLIIVSNDFNGLNRLKRHRLVYDVINEETQLIHAISLVTLTEAEWNERGGIESISGSPRCRGGSL
jgi:BolA protein